MRGPLTFALLASASLTSLALPAAAQTATPNDVEVSDEIIVTATKREQDILEVPASVSVIGSDQIEQQHITQVTDLSAAAPGLVVNSNGTPGNSIVTLRGIAQVSGGGATIGTYVDDTPVNSSSFFARGNQTSLDLFPYDLERIEILRGPQGTLYGGNAIGGLLKYVTRAPNLTEREFRVGGDVFSVADSDDLGGGARLALNLPIQENVFGLRASYGFQRTPGFVDTVAGVEDQNEVTQEGGRLSFLLEPNDDVSIRLTATFQSLDSAATSQVALSPVTGVPAFGDHVNNNVRPEPFTSDTAYFAGTINWDLGWAELVSASSYTDASSSQITDASYIYGPFGGAGGTSTLGVDVELDKFTQEFRLLSPNGGNVDWLVGVFYTREDSIQTQALLVFTGAGALAPGLNPLLLTGFDASYEETAAFGELTYHFNDRFDVTGGLRLSQIDQHVVQPATGALLGFATLSTTASDDDDVFTYSLSPRYRVNDDTIIYARIASGYRPGGPNGSLLPAPNPPAQADTLVNYELGLKSEFADRRVVVEAAVFHIDYDDIQVSTVLPGGLAAGVGNGRGAESRGVEANLEVRPFPGLRLGANAAYIEASFTDPATVLFTPVAAGDPLPNVPRWAGALTADYTTSLWGDWSGRFGGSYRYVGDRPSDVGAGAVTTESYQLVDLNADLSNGRVIVRLFANNVLEEEGYLTTGAGRPPNRLGVPVQPRTIGIGLDVAF